MAGVSPGYISQLEHGRIRRPDEALLARLARALDISVESLLLRRLPPESPDAKPLPSGPGVGLLLRSARQRKGLSITDLARQAGMKKAYISLLERDGIRKPGRERVELLAHALGISVPLLTGREMPEGTSRVIFDDGRSPGQHIDALLAASGLTDVQQRALGTALIEHTHQLTRVLAASQHALSPFALGPRALEAPEEAEPTRGEAPARWPLTFQSSRHPGVRWRVTPSGSDGITVRVYRWDDRQDRERAGAEEELLSDWNISATVAGQEAGRAHRTLARSRTDQLGGAHLTGVPPEAILAGEIVLDVRPPRAQVRQSPLQSPQRARNAVPLAQIPVGMENPSNGV